MKLIALLYVMAVQLLTASAFTARSVHNNINNRHVVVSTSTAQFMAVATPAAPVKEKVKKVTNESDNESEKAKDRGWLVRLYNDVSILLEAMYLFSCTYLYTVRRLYNIDSYDVCNIHSLSFHNIESSFVIFLQNWGWGMQNAKQQHIFVFSP